MKTAHGRALAWETWRRGRWWFLLAVASMSVFMMMLLKAVEVGQTATPAEVMHIFPLLMLCETLMFVSMLAQAQVSDKTIILISRRQYRLPVSTWELVAWRVLIGSAVVAVMHVGVAAVLGMTHWVLMPILFPILLMALAVCAVHSLLVFTGHVWLRIFAAFGLGVGAYGWFYKIHYHNAGGAWPRVGWDQIILILGLWIVFYVLAVIGAARERRGDAMENSSPPLTLGASMLRLKPRKTGFKSAAEAQLWFERSARGGPTLVAMTLLPAIIVGAMLWMGASHRDLLEGSSNISLFLLLATAFPIGGMLGATRKLNTGIDFDAFRGTRPMSDRQLAAGFLRSAAREIAGGWIAFLAILLIVNAIVYERGDHAAIVKFWSTYSSLPFPLPVRIPLAFAAGIVIHWAIINLGMSLNLTGRTFMQAGFVLIFFACLFVTPFTAKYSQFGYFLIGAVVLGSLWILFTGWRRKYVPAWMPIAALILIAAAVSYGASHPKPSDALSIIAMASLMLFTPLASTPLAIAWNRHR